MLYKGNNKLKKIYKGDEVITHIYKGDDLVFIDLETLYSYKMTIDTTLTTTSTPDLTADYFVVPLQPSNIGLKIYWGDGSYSTVTATGQKTIRHVYPAPGDYQVSFVPTQFSGQTPTSGWLTRICSWRLQANDVNDNVSRLATPEKIKSIDSVFPVGGVYFQSGSSYTSNAFAGMRNIESAPQGWLNNVTGGATPNLNGTFRDFCSNGKMSTANVSIALAEISAFSKKFASSYWGTFLYGSFCNLDEITFPDDFLVVDFRTPQYGTLEAFFRNAFQNCKKVTIGERFFTLTNPATQLSGPYGFMMDCFTQMEEFNLPERLFVINAPNATSLHYFYVFGSQGGMSAWTMKSGYSANIEVSDKFITLNAPLLGTSYDYRFSFGLPNSKANMTYTFKTGAFKVTEDITSAKGMFYNLFTDAGSGGENTVWEQKAIEINTSHCTNTSNMFYGVLGRAPIAQNVIAQMDTSNVVDFTSMFSAPNGSGSGTILWQNTITSTASGTIFKNMFSRTYYNRSTMSNTSLPANFFSNIVTTNGVDFTGMFQNCFESLRVELPTGLFATIDTTNGTTFNSMFNGLNTTSWGGNRVPLNDIFDGMPSFNWASQTHVENDNVIYGMFCFPYAGYSYLTGEANTILQHFPFTPTVNVPVFVGQSALTDYATIDSHWKTR